MNAFCKAAVAAGFTEAQADFMDEWLAGANHGHEIGDIEGLEEALGDDEDEDEEEAEEGAG